MVYAWSIGKAERGTFTDNKIPGPNKYSPEKRQKAQPPMWSIPKYEPSQHQNSNPALNKYPGPGQYNLRNEKNTGSKYTIATKAGPPNQFSKIPGPGTYNPRPQSALSKPPAYTMASKYDDGSKEYDRIGPGAYNITSGLSKHGAKIGTSGKSKKKNFKSMDPGPGSYNIDRGSTAPKARIGTSQRQELYKGSAEGVGPGNYELKTYFDKSKGFTMVSRKGGLDQQEAMRVPGPGHYNADKLQRQQPPKHKIGTSSRGDINGQLQYQPGPGQYFNDAYTISKYARGPSAKIGTDKRKPLNDVKGTPGPGQYEYRQKAIEGPKFSMKGATKIDPVIREKMSTPGPGQYNDQALNSRMRPGSAKIGTSTRQGLYPKNNNPGPGNYKFQDMKKESKGWGFGTSKRPTTAKTDQPGPGNYNIKSTVGDVPKYAQYSFKKDTGMGRSFQ